MKKIKDIINKKSRSISFELFPPKTDEGYKNLLKTIDKLSYLSPDFISCTYGAGGGNREKTFDIAQLIQDKYGIPCMAHLTCVLNTKDEIENILNDIKTRGINNILALRGDPPLENPDWQPKENNFTFSKDLCSFIRERYGDYFGIGVAGFPEGHINCKDLEVDAKYLKMKIDNGADFVITQVFLDNNDYFKYVERLKKLQVNVKIIPGILPITNYNTLLKFSTLGGAKITEETKKIFAPIQADPEATLKKGIEFAVRQCKGLLNGGAPGIHFYTLNKFEPTKMILSELI